MRDYRVLVLGALGVLGVGAAVWILAPDRSNTPKPVARPAWNGEPMAGSGAAETFALDRIEGDYTLPADNLPPGASIDLTEFVIDDLQAPQAKRPKGNVWTARLPFSVPDTAKRFKPPGMVVFVGETELAYTTGMAPQSWKIQGQQLVVQYPTRPKAVRIVLPSLAERTKRLSFAHAGLDDAAFVQFTHQIADTARQGMLLPAPAVAEWDVSLPERPTFSAALAMVEPPLRGTPSDGAVVVLSVLADGNETEIGRRAVPEASTGFEPWQADLSDFGGKKVKIRLASRPGKKNDTVNDYVFVGAPVVSTAPHDADAVRRVVHVAIDTLRPDHLGVYGYGLPTTPEIDAFAQNAAIFDLSFAPAPRTRPSFRTATTGRWPLHAVGATNIAQVFRDNGWATGAFAANIHINPRFDFDDGFDVFDLDVQATAEQQVDRGLTFLRENAHRDAYLFVHLMDPHLFYRAPDEFNARFVTDPDPSLKKVFNRWEVYQWDRQGKLSDQRKEHIKALYDAEVAYTSSQLGRLFAEVEAMPGQTLVVFYSDHGEEFWEHGGYEHNHALYNEVTRVALLVRPPGGLPAPLRIDTAVSLVDLAPTFYGFAGIETDVPLDGVSLMPLMKGQVSPEFDRNLQVAFVHYDTEQWGVIHARHKYFLRLESGKEELYDLDADRGEQNDLAATTDLEPYRKALADVHGMPVGPGWRIRVNWKGGPPVRIALPAPALHAGVVDPERISESRANQEWGEPPKEVPSDVGEVTLSEDRTQLTFAPGPVGSGLLYVLFAAPTPAGGSVSLLDGERVMETAAWTARGERALFEQDHRRLEVQPGIVCVPPPDEAARMAALRGTGEASGEDVAQLCALGYIHGEMCEQQ